MSARLTPSFAVLRWIAIPIITLHNAEEWLTMRSFGEVYVLVGQYLGVDLRQPSWPTLQLALALATVVPIAIVTAASMGARRGWKDFAVAIIVSIFAVNVFFPHVIAGLLFGGYTPGLASAVLVNLPFSILFFRSALADGRITFSDMRRALIIGAGLLPVSVALLLFPSLVS